MAIHEKDQQRMVEIIEAVLKHAAELKELSDELEAMGCTCGNSGAEVPAGHLASCALVLAWTLRSHEGLECPDESVIEKAKAEWKCVRHLAAPFPLPSSCVRATCPECKRYAQREERIPHTKKCSQNKEAGG